MILLNEVFVHLVDFPSTKVAEAVTQNEDGSYSIFLNSRMTHERCVDAYFHALGHITENDFEKNDVQEIESCAHERRLVV